MKTTKSHIMHPSTTSQYNPELDYSDEMLLVSKKLIKAKELLSKSGLPKQVVEQLNKEKSL